MTAADTSAGTRHQLRPGEPLSRESLAFMLQLPDAGIGVAAYTWVNGERRAGSVLAVFGPGVPDGALAEGIDDVEIADEVGFDDWAVGAMRLEVTDPMQAAVVHFAGDRLDMEYRFDGFHPAYLYSNHPDGSPRFFADDRYEQSGRVTGHLTIDGTTVPIDTTAHRDHSWGTRDWGAVQHYKWIVAEAGADTALHWFEIQALGRNYLRGYVHRDGEMAEIRSVDSRFGHDDRWRQTSVDGTVTDAAGRTTDFTSQTYATFPTHHGPLTAIETAMTVTIDGTPGVGHVEMAWHTPYLEQLTRFQTTPTDDRPGR